MFKVTTSFIKPKNYIQSRFFLVSQLFSWLFFNLKHHSFSSRKPILAFIILSILLPLGSVGFSQEESAPVMISEETLVTPYNPTPNAQYSKNDEDTFIPPNQINTIIQYELARIIENPHGDNNHASGFDLLYHINSIDEVTARLETLLLGDPDNESLKNLILAVQHGLGNFSNRLASLTIEDQPQVPGDQDPMTPLKNPIFSRIRDEVLRSMSRSGRYLKHSEISKIVQIEYIRFLRKSTRLNQHPSRQGTQQLPNSEHISYIPRIYTIQYPNEQFGVVIVISQLTLSKEEGVEDKVEYHVVLSGQDKQHFIGSPAEINEATTATQLWSQLQRPLRRTLAGLRLHGGIENLHVHVLDKDLSIITTAVYENKNKKPLGLIDQFKLHHDYIIEWPQNIAAAIFWSGVLQASLIGAIYIATKPVTDTDSYADQVALYHRIGSALIFGSLRGGLASLSIANWEKPNGAMVRFLKDFAIGSLFIGTIHIATLVWFNEYLETGKPLEFLPQFASKVLFNGAFFSIIRLYPIRLINQIEFANPHLSQTHRLIINQVGRFWWAFLLSAFDSITRRGLTFDFSESLLPQITTFDYISPYNILTLQKTAALGIAAAAFAGVKAYPRLYKWLARRKLNRGELSEAQYREALRFADTVLQDPQPKKSTLHGFHDPPSNTNLTEPLQPQNKIGAIRKFLGGCRSFFR